MKTPTCVEFLENIMFRTIGIQVGDFTNVPDAIAKATDLKVPLDEGLDVLDFQSPICKNRMSKKAAPVCVPVPLASMLLQQNHESHICCVKAYCQSQTRMQWWSLRSQSHWSEAGMFRWACLWESGVGAASQWNQISAWKSQTLQTITYNQSIGLFLRTEKEDSSLLTPVSLQVLLGQLHDSLKPLPKSEDSAW